METLELKKYAAKSVEYHNIDPVNEHERNDYFYANLNPYWEQFGETDVSLTTVIFSHINDMQYEVKKATANIRGEFVKWLLSRYPNTENVCILAHAEFAEFQSECPHFFD